MTLDRATVEEGARLAAEATPGPWTAFGAGGDWWLETSNLALANFKEDGEKDAAFIAHWNPEFAAEVARDWLRFEEALAKSEEKYAWAKVGLESLDYRLGLANAAADKAEAEVERLRRVEEAARAARYEMSKHRHDVWCGDYEQVLHDLDAALANPAAEEGDG